MKNNATMLASALAYSSFFAIPSVLLVTVGVFTLVAGPDTITTLMAHFGTVMPAQATELLGSSLKNLDAHPASSVVMTVVGFVLALWSTTGAMNAYMLAINLANERKDKRSFVRKRIVALEMVVVIGFALVLVAVLLIFGPQIENSIASHAGAFGGVLNVVWWIAQVPILLGGLLAAFATLLYLGPDPSTARGSSSRRARSLPRWLDRDLGSLRRVHVDVRLVQQDVGRALCRDRHAHVAVALGDRDPLRRRGECGARAQP